MFTVIFILQILLVIYEGKATLYTCETILENHPCKTVVSGKTLVPNLLSHPSQEVALKELTELPLNDECSNRLKSFLCFVYAPPCSIDQTNYPIPPCRGFCKTIRANCDIPWPDQLDCSKFPEDGGYCKCENGSTIAKKETKKYTCYPLQAHSICKYQNTTLMPNLVNDETPEEAVTTISQLSPLIKMGCNPHLAIFACAIFLPNCTENKVFNPPCRDLCLSVRSSCEPVMNMFGFDWPNKFECDNFPLSSCVTYNGSVIALDNTKEHTTKYVCEDIESDSMCKEFSDKIILPNFVNQSIQHEATNEILKYSPLISVDCNPDYKKFICSVYFPSCSGNKPKPPCKSMCENVRSGCEHFLTMMGLEWPEEFNCDNFRDTNCVKSIKVKKQHGINKEDVLVTLPSGGQLLGSIMETINNEDPIFSFRGIPYAEPPIEDLRFKPPVGKRLKTSEKPFDATEDGPECMQADFGQNSFSGVEDCLILNVYTRNINKSEQLRPVMVAFHGGGFCMGSSNSYSLSPSKLLEYDVVLVTMNYRLHLFGFLTTMDEASPGNYGLMDQTEALRWVRDNIQVFSGDPNNVNIFGISAGGASVLYHILSPLSKGLFHSAISQSGNPLSPLAEQYDPITYSQRLGDDLGCSTTNSTKLVQCLRLMPAEKLIKQLKIYLDTVYIPFGPVTDGIFLPNSPYHLLKEGKVNKVPLIIGLTEEEGAFFYAIKFENIDHSLTNDFLRHAIAFTLNTRPNFVTQNAIDVVRNQYFQSVDVNNTKLIREIGTKMFSDHMFVIPNFQTVQLLNENGIEPFVYSYDLFFNRSLSIIIGYKDLQRASHGDDALFLFKTDFINPRVNQTIYTMLQMWTKFVQYGHPTKFLENNVTEWPASKKDNIQIYHLNHDFQVQSYDPENDKLMNFWLKDFKEAMRVH